MHLRSCCLESSGWHRSIIPLLFATQSWSGTFATALMGVRVFKEFWDSARLHDARLRRGYSDEEDESPSQQCACVRLGQMYDAMKAKANLGQCYVDNKSRELN